LRESRVRLQLVKLNQQQLNDLLAIRCENDRRERKNETKSTFHSSNVYEMNETSRIL
jgi:hypothetical protein